MLNEQSESWSIAIDGKWGTGKTFFVKQCKLLLDCLNEIQSNEEKSQSIIETVCNGKIDDVKKINYKTVYFDAWQNDSEIDPIVSLSKNIASAEFVLKSEVKDKAIKMEKSS